MGSSYYDWTTELIQPSRLNLPYDSSGNLIIPVKNASIESSGNIFSKIWTDYSSISTIVGGDGTYDTKYIYYKKVGYLVYVKFNLYILAAHSSGTAFSFTVPYNSVSDGVGNSFIQLFQAIKNTTYSVGILSLAVAGNVVTLASDVAGTTWSNGQAKGAWGEFWYETSS